MRGKVLVDTSVWISYFRGASSRFTDHLDELLRHDAACLTAIIRAELLSGTRHEKEFLQLSDRLGAVDRLPEPEDLWDRVAYARFLLARRGVQASLTDLSIAEMARHHRCLLLTEDKEFRPIARVISFQFFLS